MTDGSDSTEPAAAAAPAPDPSAPAQPIDDDFGPPFAKKSFGGAFVWAKSPRFVATVLRIREGKNVPIATAGRDHMTVMLTGGRAVLEVHAPDGVDRVELLPAAPVEVRSDLTYRLLSLTEVELLTVFAPQDPPA